MAMTEETTMKSFKDRLYAARVRINELIWVPGMAADTPRNFEDFIGDGDAWDAPQVLSTLPWLRELLDCQAEPDDIASEFVNKAGDGFLVQLGTPSPSRPGGPTPSWGATRYEWFFVASLDELCATAERWSADIIASAKARAAAG